MHRTQKNMISALTAQIVTIATGFLVQRYVLMTFGSDYNGLTSAVTQILQYLVLLEAGLTTASIQALYKPIIDKDYATISGILSATNRKLIKIGMAFFAALLISSLILPFVVGDEVEYWLAFSITLASGAGTGITYMLVNKYQALLYADNKTGVVYNLTSFSNVLICIVKILFMQMGMSIVFVQAVTLLGVFFKVACLHIIFKRQYVEVSFSASPRYDLISKSNNVLVHQIAGFVNNNTDVLLITAFASLKSVSLYSVYNMVYAHINTFLQSVFAQAPLGFVGQSYAKDREEFKKIYDTFEVGYIFIMFVILSAVMEMIIAFVGLYTKGVNDIEYRDCVLAELFFIAQVLNLVRVPSIVAINVSGHFKETQKGAIIEALVNLSVSIPMFFLIGIRGLLLGTIAAMCFRSVDITYYVYKNIRGKKMRFFFSKIALHFMMAFVCIVIIAPVVTNYATTWPRWIISGCGALTLTALLYLIMESIFFGKEMKNCLIMVKKTIKDKPV